MSKKLGLTIGPLITRFGVDRAMEIVKEAGFDAVDFSLDQLEGKEDIYAAPEADFIAYFTAAKEKAAALGLIISQTHGRCCIYQPDNPAFNDQAMATTRQDLWATALLGVPACVVHSLSSCRCRGFTPEEMHAKNRALFTVFYGWAEEFGVKVSQETFGDAGMTALDFFGDVQELKAQYDSIDTPYKTLCMDTGHTNKATRFGVMPPEEAIRYLGKDITLLHLNDNNGWSDQHQPPCFGGTVHWSAVLKALEDIGYEGVYNFELTLWPFKNMLEEYVHYLGKHLRYFLDHDGKMG